MIDIHTHILPGLDDGAGDIYDSLEMVRIAADNGVTAIVATPHCNIPGLYRNYIGKEYVEAFHKTVRAIERERIPVKLLPGMEVYSTYDLPDLIVERKIMPLNRSRYILMEFSFGEDPEFADDVLKRVRKTGANPVVAHVERYEFVQQDPRIIYNWRRKGYVIQVNKGSFLGRFGERAMVAAHRLMRHHLVSAVASDAHSPYQRTPYMLDAYEELHMKYPKEKLEVLFRKNPARICSNQPILNLEPMPFCDD